jgi:hypothetical protein
MLRDRTTPDIALALKYGLNQRQNRKTPSSDPATHRIRTVRIHHIPEDADDYRVERKAEASESDKRNDP